MPTDHVAPGPEAMEPPPPPEPAAPQPRMARRNLPAVVRYLVAALAGAVLAGGATQLLRSVGF